MVSERPSYVRPRRTAPPVFPNQLAIGRASQRPREMAPLSHKGGQSHLSVQFCRRRDTLSRLERNKQSEVERRRKSPASFPRPRTRNDGRRGASVSHKDCSRKRATFPSGSRGSCSFRPCFPGRGGRYETILHKRNQTSIKEAADGGQESGSKRPWATFRLATKREHRNRNHRGATRKLAHATPEGFYDAPVSCKGSKHAYREILEGIGATYRIIS